MAAEVSAITTGVSGPFPVTQPATGAGAWWLMALWLGLAVTAVSLLAVLLYPLTSLPITYDDLLYLSLAYEPRPEAWVLNRYFHVSQLAAFMVFVEQPFDAARWWWSFTAGMVLTATVVLLRVLPAAARPPALAVLALLLLTRISYSWYLGVPYADFSVMLMVALSVALVAEPVFTRRELPAWTPVLLGLLLVLGIRSKETAVILLWLLPLGLLRPDGALRFDRAALGFAGRYLFGALLGLVVMAGCEFWLLGDPLFGLRPSSWQALLSYNTGNGGVAQSEFTWLTWLVRPDAFAATLLYVLAGCCLAAFERDRRALLLFTLPIGYMILLTLLGMVSAAPVNARTVLPIQPLMAGLTTVVLFRVIWAMGRHALTRLTAAYLLGLAALAAFWLLFTQWREPPEALFNQSSFIGTLVPLTVFGSLLMIYLGLAGPARLRLPAVLGVAALLGISLLPPGFRVVRSLQWRSLQTWAEKRFKGLRELARELSPAPDGRILIERLIYNGELMRWDAQLAYYQLSAARRYDRSSLMVVDDLPAVLAGLRPGDLLLAQPDALADALLEVHGASADEPSPPGWRMITASDGRIAALVSSPDPLHTQSGMAAAD